MEEYNLLPLWYKNKQNKKIQKGIKRLLLLLLLGNTLLIFNLGIILYNGGKSRNQQNLKEQGSKQEGDFSQQMDHLEQFKKDNNRQLMNLTSLLKIEEFVKGTGLKLLNSNIKGKTLSLEVVVNDYERYIALIRYLEQQIGICIKSLVPEGESLSRFTVKIIGEFEK